MPTDVEPKNASERGPQALASIPGEDLTLRQRQAAVLDAAGMTTAQIGTILKLHPKTVEKWRRDENYSGAVKEYEMRQAQDLEPVVARIQLEMAEAVVKAIRTINDAMDAKTKAGTPSWAARLRAAADALNNAKLISPSTLAPKNGDGGGAGGAPNYAVIRVELPEGSNVKPPDEVVEAEVVPEAREIGPGDGDGSAAESDA